MAAGLGTRLRPLTETVPKPLLPIAGKPILEWGIDRLPDQIGEVILVVGYLQEQIRGHFGETWHGRRIRYVEQADLKGTGNAVHCCRKVLDDRFLVMNGDDLYSTNDISEAAKCPLAILAKETENAGRFGSLRTDGDGNLVAIEENADDRIGLVNTGLYVLSQEFFGYDLVPIKCGKEFGLPQTLAVMSKDFPVTVVRAGFWLPIGYPEDLSRATEILSETAP